MKNLKNETFSWKYVSKTLCIMPWKSDRLYYDNTNEQNKLNLKGR